MRVTSLSAFGTLAAVYPPGHQWGRGRVKLRPLRRRSRGEGSSMIIDAHAHYTSAPPELQAYRGRQIMNLRQPPRPRLQVSDEQLERSMRNQFKRMQDSGIDRLLFSPQAS